MYVRLFLYEKYCKYYEKTAIFIIKMTIFNLQKLFLGIFLIFSIAKHLFV